MADIYFSIFKIATLKQTLHWYIGVGSFFPPAAYAVYIRIKIVWFVFKVGVNINLLEWRKVHRLLSLWDGCELNKVKNRLWVCVLVDVDSQRDHSPLDLCFEFTPHPPPNPPPTLLPGSLPPTLHTLTRILSKLR